MLKKLNRILNVFIGVLVGVFVGHGIYVFWDYKSHPDLYAMQSAPWYTSVLVYGVFTILFLAAAVLIKFMIRKKENVKKQEKKSDG
ncbi:MAG: hypothetical protein Q4E24_07190 [bacterium]|nr:hypothetical protein [bacterium]